MKLDIIILYITYYSSNNSYVVQLFIIAIIKVKKKIFTKNRNLLTVCEQETKKSL